MTDFTIYEVYFNYCYEICKKTCRILGIKLIRIEKYIYIFNSGKNGRKIILQGGSIE